MNKLHVYNGRNRRIKNEVCSQNCFCFRELFLSFFVYYIVLVVMGFTFILLDPSETLTIFILLVPILMFFAFPFFSIVLLFSASEFMLVPLLTPLIIYLMTLNSRKNTHKLLRVLVNSFGMLILFGLPAIIIDYSGLFFV